MKTAQATSSNLTRDKASSEDDCSDTGHMERRVLPGSYKMAICCLNVLTHSVEEFLSSEYFEYNSPKIYNAY